MMNWLAMFSFSFPFPQVQVLNVHTILNWLLVSDYPQRVLFLRVVWREEGSGDGDRGSFVSRVCGWML